MQPFTLHHYNGEKPLSSLPLDTRSRFLAGGTNLIDLMKLQVETPKTLVSLAKWDKANTISEDDNYYYIGAMVTNSDLAKFAHTQPNVSLLAQALLSGATVQLRNRATTAGNLLQRTRCYYFYDTTKACNKREPGTGCSAYNSMNRIHAIFGTSESCIATHPSDMAVAMIALNAQVHTQQPDGNTRQIALRDFYREPGDTPHIETQLDEDELITHVSIKKKANSPVVVWAPSLGIRKKQSVFLKARNQPKKSYCKPRKLSYPKQKRLAVMTLNQNYCAGR